MVVFHSYVSTNIRAPLGSTEIIVALIMLILLGTCYVAARESMTAVTGPGFTW